MGSSSFPDTAAITLDAEELEAVVLPAHGMLVASLRHRGEELLRRVDRLADAARRGSTAGIPFLHPWANRLASRQYDVAGRRVTLDPNSALLHVDGAGLPIHGVPWSRLAWTTTHVDRREVRATLLWRRPDLLAVFPFPHRIDMTVSLDVDSLRVEVLLTADAAGPVPISFGFHPYIGLPRSPRQVWRLELPARRQLALDARGIPTGGSATLAPGTDPLGDRALDDAFVLTGARPSLAIADDTRRVAIEFLEGFRFAQVFAPVDASGVDVLGVDACVALEPMTAPTNALIDHRDLTIIQPDDSFRAAFRVRVEAPA